MSNELSPSQDLVSIIIPIYNTGEYLAECLQSCLDQTYTNIEVIAVDDCSTDPRTIEILKEYEQKDPRIKVIWSKENRGQGHCRNVGVDACKGKYFSFIDSDDYFKPEFVEKMYQGLEKFKTSFAICDTLNYVDDPRMYEMKSFQVDDSATRFNFKSKDQTVVNNYDLAAVGFLISFPASCYGKMFDTQKYREGGVTFYDGEFSHHCQDEDWATYSILNLENFVVLKFTGLMRRMHFGTASSPSVEYFRCSVDAAYRRFMAVTHRPFSHYYENSVISDLLNRLSRMCFLTLNYEDRLKVIDLAHEYLRKTEPKFNINPYGYSWLSSKGWHTILSVIDNKPLPLVYFSLHSLQNSHWRETFATKQLLEALAAYGIFTTSFNALGVESAIPVKRYISIEKELQYFSINDPDFKYNPSAALFDYKDNGVSYLVAKTTPFTPSDKYNETDLQIINEGMEKTVTSYFKKKGVGIVMVSGADRLSQEQCIKARERGAKVVYLIDQPEAFRFQDKDGNDVLQNQLIDNASPVPEDTQFVFAPSEFDAIFSMNPYYAQRFGELYHVKVETMGYVVNPYVSLEINSNHNFITFTNPTLEHGLALFIKLVDRFAKICPSQSFMLVQDEDKSLQQSLVQLHDKEGTPISKLGLSFKKLSLVSETQLDPISIASQTQILVVPGSTNQSSISNILECQVNDVPVLTSNMGKYETILSEQDQSLPLPQCVLDDPTCLPDDDEIEPWVQALLAMTKKGAVKRTAEEKQDKYRKVVSEWVHRLYEIAEVPEIHDHEDDSREI